MIYIDSGIGLLFLTSDCSVWCALSRIQHYECMHSARTADQGEYNGKPKHAADLPLVMSRGAAAVTIDSPAIAEPTQHSKAPRTHHLLSGAGCRSTDHHGRLPRGLQGGATYLPPNLPNPNDFIVTSLQYTAYRRARLID
jgi:hypothetical protein